MSWLDFMATVVQYTVPPLALISSGMLVSLVGIAVRRLSRWLGLRESAVAAEQAQGLARQAVRYAEQQALLWAKRRGQSMVGIDKLDQALKWARAEMYDRGIPEITRARLVRLIEAELGERLVP